MNKIQYKILHPAHYEIREGVKVDFNGIDLAYTKENESFVVTHINSGVKVPGTFRNEHEINSYLEKNSEDIMEFVKGERCKELTDRLNFVVSKEEYDKMLSLFEECIGLPAHRFYNEAILLTTKDIKFDIVKFDSYIYKSYGDYYDGISCKEFVESKFGKEMLNIIEYFMKI